MTCVYNASQMEWFVGFMDFMDLFDFVQKFEYTEDFSI